MEDYIFILIAIVLSIIGAVNKNKKKQAAQNNPDFVEPEREPSIFDQIFEDPVFDEETVKRAPKVAPEPEVVVKKRVSREPLKPTVMTRTEIGDAIKTSIGTDLKDEEKEQQEVETTRESILSDFSLRKAVIYSEILERKY